MRNVRSQNDTCRYNIVSTLSDALLRYVTVMQYSTISCFTQISELALSRVSLCSNLTSSCEFWRPGCWEHKYHQSCSPLRPPSHSFRDIQILVPGICQSRFALVMHETYGTLQDRASRKRQERSHEFQPTGINSVQLASTKAPLATLMKP